jgi:hypothetical protein
LISSLALNTIIPVHAYILERDPPVELGFHSTVKEDAQRARDHLNNIGVNCTRIMVSTLNGSMCISTDSELSSDQVDLLALAMDSWPEITRGDPQEAPPEITNPRFYNRVHTLALP